MTFGILYSFRNLRLLEHSTQIFSIPNWQTHVRNKFKAAWTQTRHAFLYHYQFQLAVAPVHHLSKLAWPIIVCLISFIPIMPIHQ